MPADVNNSATNGNCVIRDTSDILLRAFYRTAVGGSLSCPELSFETRGILGLDAGELPVLAGLARLADLATNWLGTHGRCLASI